MKFVSLITASVVALAAQSVLAQARSATDLTRQAQNLSRLIEDRADNMSGEQMMRVSQLLSETKRAVLGESSRPTPPPAEIGRRMLIKGDVEQREFTFDVRTQNELSRQCSDFVTRNLGNNAQADDIRVSINLSNIQPLKNSASYWKGQAQICQQIMNMAVNAGLSSRGIDAEVHGNIEGREFAFTGRDRLDLFGQCESFVKSNLGNNAQADDIYVVNNFVRERVLKNSASYWKGSLEICTQILNEQN